MIRIADEETPMKPIFETIQKRHSIRTYDPRPIEEEILDTMRAYMEGNEGNDVGPFGNTVTCKITTLIEDSERELKKYVSYGNVKGARYFIAGSVKTGLYAMEDFGYCMEKNILKATDLGLATVWLGGALNRSTFADALNITEDAVIPAITPLGYAAPKRSMMDKVIKTMSGGKNRKEFGSLFFSGSPSEPLEKSLCGEYADALEAVRLAPSASNLQPWRVIREKEKKIFHFYMKESAGNSATGNIHIQNNDMGIAMCHFEMTAREAGLSGRWRTEKPELDAGNWKYITSWTDTGAESS